jgi:hypothetical protein
MNNSHGRKRQQQRGIPNLIVEWLQRFGCEHHDGNGAVIHYFDRRARRKLERCVGTEPVRRMHEYLDAYAVVRTSGELVTVGHRYERIRR